MSTTRPKWPHPYHVLAVLQELGPECCIDAERLRVRLRSADMLYRSMKECAAEVPGLTEVKATFDRRMAAINAMRKALTMPDYPLSPSLRARVEEELADWQAEVVDEQEQGIWRANLRRLYVSGLRNTEGERMLVQHLGETFCLATGERPTVSENKAETGEAAFGGRFMRFLRLVLGMMDVKITGGAVVKYVTTADYRRRILEQKASGGYPAASHVNIDLVAPTTRATEHDTEDDRRSDI